MKYELYPTTKTKKRYLSKAFWLLVWALVLLGLYTLLYHPDWLVLGRVEAAQRQSFDHSNCQYPERWTNPADSCDNSDPAVPECIKSFSTEQGEKDCIAAFVKANEQPAPVVQKDNTLPDESLFEPKGRCGK